MILLERKKFLAAICFLLAGVIGLFSLELPVDKNLILFPIFSGFFGMSMLLLQIRKKSVIPKQHKLEREISRKTINRSVLFGSIAGFFSGLVPAIGSSQMAFFASMDRNDNSFLITVGAITTANIILSFLALWLIGRARSGVAVAASQFITINFQTFVLIVSIAVVACAIAAITSLKLTRIILRLIEKIDYSAISKSVIVFLNIAVFAFTGLMGLFLLWLCCLLGLVPNLARIRRSHLMGVLILPTILFFMGFV